MGNVRPPPSLKRTDRAAIDSDIKGVILRVIDAMDQFGGHDLEKKIAEIQKECCQDRDQDFCYEVQKQIKLAEELFGGPHRIERGRTRRQELAES